MCVAFRTLYFHLPNYLLIRPVDEVLLGDVDLLPLEQGQGVGPHQLPGECQGQGLVTLPDVLACCRKLIEIYQNIQLRLIPLKKVSIY